MAAGGGTPWCMNGNDDVVVDPRTVLGRGDPDEATRLSVDGSLRVNNGPSLAAIAVCHEPATHIANNSSAHGDAQ